MAARKRRLAYEEDDDPRGVIRPKRDAAPEIDICSLLQRGSVLHSILTEHCFAAYFFAMRIGTSISVAFYPTQGCAAHVEFVTAKAAPIRLTEQQVTALAVNLPRLCDALCANEHYTSGVHDGS